MFVMLRRIVFQTFLSRLIICSKYYTESYFRHFYLVWSYVRYVTQNRISDIFISFDHMFEILRWIVFQIFLSRLIICSICYAESYFRYFYLVWSYVRYVTQNRISDVFISFDHMFDMLLKIRMSDVFISLDGFISNCCRVHTNTSQVYLKYVAN
jgi:hypothetical protein